MFDEFENNLEAKSFLTASDNYHIQFKELLQSIYECSNKMILDKVKLIKNENKIRDILVDYLVENIKDYEFKKEEPNNLGRVDIYIVDTFTDTTPHFIIECKLLDNKTMNGKDGLNGKYIQNGIERFLIEHYFLENNFKTNSMVAFIVSDIDIIENIKAINKLTKKFFNNIIEITQEIILEDKNIYKSSYQTGKPEKDFHIYHLMMDFSRNIT
jgi:hypothetical protein